MAPPNDYIAGQTDSVPDAVNNAINIDSNDDGHGEINLIKKSVFQLV